MATPITPPPFLEKHLEKIAGQEGLLDYTIEYSAGSKHGDGFMAAVLSVTLKGSSKDGSGKKAPKTVSLICKLMPDNKERQEVFSGHIVFEREVHFYNEILPQFQQIQQKHGIGEEHGFFGYPQCYAAVADADTDEYVIIMRDVRVDGYTLWNKLEPITFEKVVLLMQQLGRFHGLGLVLREQQPEWFRQIHQLSDLLLNMSTKPSIINLFDSTYDQALRLLENEEHKKVVEYLKTSWAEIMGECMKSESSEPFTVINHGDCWNNNFMFSDAKICMLDWQICRFASPALDLVYFFLTSANKELRDRHFDELLRIYHDNFTGIIQRCGGTAGPPFRLEDLHEQLRKFGRYGVVMAPMLLQVIVSDPSNISNMDEMAAAVGEGGQVQNAFAKFDDGSTANYRKRLGDSINDAKRWGWI